MSRVRYPSLYQINTRVYLTKLSRTRGRLATLDDIPDVDLDALAARGFDWIWFLGVWQTGPTGRELSRSVPEWRREFQELLPDLSEEDIPGSPFAVADYSVHSNFGGDPALARLRERLTARKLKLMLDFVPNHTARDHPWVAQHPEFYVSGDEAALAREPRNYTRVGGSKNRPGRIIAYGRDPYFPGWPDTFQLNYGQPAVQEAMTAQLLKIASRCDGVRCDMAMLVLPEVFERTWGIKAEPFWPKATRAVRERYPEFRFMAEVYWDLEWALQHQGFDYCYDKRLYDRLQEGHARPVREHLWAGLDFQDRLARFLENHDEPRAAAVFPPEMHRAAAVITFFAPGLRFFHQGQLEGYRKRIPVHLRRGPDEAVDSAIAVFYDRLLECLKDAPVRDGEWRLLESFPAWDGNATFDNFIAYAWSGPGDAQRLVAVNFGRTQGQCYLRLPFPKLAGRGWRLQDQMGPASYDRDGDDLLGSGLFLDMPAWGYHVFSVNEQVQSRESSRAVLLAGTGSH
jgi:hypothetical protein